MKSVWGAAGISRGNIWIKERRGHDGAGGGTRFLDSQGPFIGPGQVGIISLGGTNLVVSLSLLRWHAPRDFPALAIPAIKVGRRRLAGGGLETTLICAKRAC